MKIKFIYDKDNHKMSRLVNADTGELIEDVHNINWVSSIDNTCTKLIIEINDPQVEMK